MVTTIRLPDELHEDLKGQAEKKGMTFNAYLLGILWELREERTKEELEGMQTERERPSLTE